MLLKNAKSILPLAPLHNGSVAVVGTDASSAAASEGGGSAHVMGPFLVKPLTAIEQSIRRRNVAYAPGEPLTPHLPLIPVDDFHSGSPLPVSAPLIHHHLEPGKSDLGIIHAKGVTKEIATAEYPESTGSAWTTWKATIVPPKSGLYELSLGENGDTWLSINGNDVMAFRGLHGQGDLDHDRLSRRRTPLQLRARLVPNLFGKPPTRMGVRNATHRPGCDAREASAHRSRLRERLQLRGLRPSRPVASWRRRRTHRGCRCGKPSNDRRAEHRRSRAHAMAEVS